jgi:serine/threonine protein kinase
VILYLLITKSLPFEGDSAASTLAKILSDQPAPFSSFGVSCPPGLEAITLKALAKDPSQRYSSADEFALALEKIRTEPHKVTVSELLQNAKFLEQTGDLVRAEDMVKRALRIDGQNATAASLHEHLRQKRKTLPRTEAVQALRQRAQEALAQRNFDVAASCVNEALAFGTTEDLLELQSEIKQARIEAESLEQTQNGFSDRNQPLGQSTLMRRVVVLMMASGIGLALALILRVRSLIKPNPYSALVNFLPIAIPLAVVMGWAAAPVLIKAVTAGGSILRRLILRSQKPIEIDTGRQSSQSTVLFARPETTLLKADQELGRNPSTRSRDSATQIFEAGFPDSLEGDTRNGVTLTFTHSSDPLLVGKAVTVSSFPFRIGRAEANVHLDVKSDASVSRAHAAIEHDRGIFTITDLDSSNGTYVNGRQLLPNSPEILPFGALIRIGIATALVFSSDQFTELPDLTGQILDRRFELKRVIHNGSKSGFYEADDLHLPRKVAVKVLAPILSRYPKYLDQFEREATIAASLQHPRICKVIDRGKALINIGPERPTLTHYLVMELMEGVSLSEHTLRDNPLPLTNIISCVDDLSEALQYIHSKGIIHNGVMLSSVLFDREGRAFLTDFAMATTTDDLTSPPIIGKADFLAPEQWDRKPLTSKVDQYSLAVLVYVLLTGTYPFQGQSEPQLRMRNLSLGPMPAHEEASRRGRMDVPPSVSDVLSRAMSLNPDARYSAVRDFFLAFKGAMNPLSSPPSSSKTPKVFISYRRGPGSSGWVNYLATELRRRFKISAFVDTQRTDSAGEISSKIKKEIEDCDVFVCLLSGDTLASEWVDKEIRLASEYGKMMLPIFQESFGFPSDADLIDVPHVRQLIEYDGIRLSDDTEAEHTVRVLAKKIKSSYVKDSRHN